MNQAQRSSSREFCPIVGSAQPVKVLAEESVGCGAAVCKGVGKSDGGMVDGVTVLERFLRFIRERFKL